MYIHRRVYINICLSIMFTFIYSYTSYIYTIYHMLYTIYYILYTTYYILYTIYYILYTIYYTLYRNVYTHATCTYVYLYSMCIPSIPSRDLPPHLSILIQQGHQCRFHSAWLSAGGNLKPQVILGGFS